MIFNSLRNRIVLFFTLLLVTVQTVAFLLVNGAYLRITQQQTLQELDVGERVFQRLLLQNRQRLLDSTRLLAADYGFREAVTTNDANTILSVLNNHGSRIKADVMQLATLNNIVVADTLHPQRYSQPSPLSGLYKTAQQKGNASGLVIIDGKAYQIVIVPVLAPDPIAWIASGILINDALATDLQNLTGLQITFFSKNTNGPWSLLASTLANDGRQTLFAALSPMTLAQASTTPMTTADYKFRTIVLEQQQLSAILAVLQRSTAETRQTMSELWYILVGLALASLLLSGLGSIFIASKIARPLGELAFIIDKIRQGDYHYTANLQQTGMSEKTRGLREVEILRMAYVEILRLAHQDMLTGLPNRTLFNDRLEQTIKLAKRTQEPFALLMVDLDRFKVINDTMGHQAGDEVLKVVAERLRSVVREADTVARLGGDEFAILLLNCDPENVGNVIHTLNRHLDLPTTINKQRIDIGCSIGVAIYPVHGKEVDVLMRHADMAMYTAKRTKSGYAIYDEKKAISHWSQLALINDLRKAVEENELSLRYQPRIDLSLLRVVAMEALVQWHHPSRGVIPPGDFIPDAENIGVIRHITRWVIKTAVAQCAAWLAQGLYFKVSVNISPNDLLAKDFNLVRTVKEELQAHNVPPSMLSLELTESSVIKDHTYTQETLVQLRKMGIEIVIDNYGVGYASLNQMKSLPFTGLKIDHSFIENISHNEENKAIVGSIIGLAHNLQLTVIAGGVEHDRELTHLQQLGCDQAQGFLISRPLPPEKVQEWLASTPLWGELGSSINRLTNTNQVA